MLTAKHRTLIPCLASLGMVVKDAAENLDDGESPSLCHPHGCVSPTTVRPKRQAPTSKSDRLTAVFFPSRMSKTPDTGSNLLCFSQA